MQSLYEHLRALAHADSARPALLVCDAGGTIVEEISRAEVLTRVQAAAAYLQSRGLRAGDRVALEFGNSADLLILSWAAWATGIVTVPLDMKRDTDELREYKIKTTGATLSIRQEEFLKATTAPGDASWMPGLSHEALVLFTSGTTAHPKGARLTLQNLVVNAESIIEWLHITEDDRFLVELPLHHINATTFCLASLVARASVALPPVYSNSRFFNHAAHSGATFTSVVPSIIFDQLGRTKEFAAVNGLLRLNRIQIGSAPVTASAALEFIDTYHIPLYQGYGQTETALRVTGVPMDLSADAYRKLVSDNSIGTPMSWAHVEIADKTGRIMGEEEGGELIVKGPAVMQGYLGGEPAFRDGYFLTGDIGYWKKSGEKRFFYLVGRAKEILIKGGVNISPVAVESALQQVSTNIDQAYVVGKEDDRYGEEVAAAIVWKKGVEPTGAMRALKLTLLAEHQILSDYEIPKYLVTIGIDDLPVTSTGKVQRTILKKTCAGGMSSVYELLTSPEFQCIVIPSQSRLVEASRALYNHCWQPLEKSASAYKKYLGEYLTLGAIDSDGALAGHISFSYADKKITCVSICSAGFIPKPVPHVAEIPDTEFVRQYLRAGNDPVMNFHHTLGAKLVEVTAGGRPEDASSLGYTMLVRYPPIETREMAGPVSHQLIQAVRILASDTGAEVYALSRPGGLAAYLERTA